MFDEILFDSVFDTASDDGTVSVTDELGTVSFDWVDEWFVLSLLTEEYFVPLSTVVDELVFVSGTELSVFACDGPD